MGKSKNFDDMDTLIIQSNSPSCVTVNRWDITQSELYITSTVPCPHSCLGFEANIFLLIQHFDFIKTTLRFIAFCVITFCVRRFITLSRVKKLLTGFINYILRQVLLLLHFAAFPITFCVSVAFCGYYYFCGVTRNDIRDRLLVDLYFNSVKPSINFSAVLQDNPRNNSFILIVNSRFLKENEINP